MFGKSYSLAWPPHTVLVLVLAVLSAGCGSKGTVSGKVFYRGKPLPRGMVTFVPEGKGETRTARINEDGSYRIDRVPAGPAKIAVISYAGPSASLPGPGSRTPGIMERKPPKDAPPEVKDIFPSGKTSEYVTIPKQYEDPDKSGLTYTVKSGSQDFDIQLK